MEDKKLKERDFQVYVGWKIPLFIKMAWAVLVIWQVFYLVSYLIPNLKVWLNK